MYKKHIAAGDSITVVRSPYYYDEEQSPPRGGGSSSRWRTTRPPRRTRSKPATLQALDGVASTELQGVASNQKQSSSHEIFRRARLPQGITVNIGDANGVRKKPFQ